MIPKIISLIDLLLIALNALVALFAISVVFALRLKLKDSPDAGWWERLRVVIKTFPGEPIAILILVSVIVLLPSQLVFDSQDLSQDLKKTVLVTVQPRDSGAVLPTSSPPKLVFAPFTVTPVVITPSGMSSPTKATGVTPAPTPSAMQTINPATTTPTPTLTPMPSATASNTPELRPTPSAKPDPLPTRTPTDTPTPVPTPLVPVQCRNPSDVGLGFGFRSPASNSIIAVPITFEIQVARYAYYTIRYAKLGAEPKDGIEYWPVPWAGECQTIGEGKTRCQRSTDGKDTTKGTLSDGIISFSMNLPTSETPYVFLLELEGGTNGNGTNLQPVCRYITNVTLVQNQVGVTQHGNLSR